MATIAKKKGKRGTSYRVQVRKKGVYEAATFKKLEHAKRWASKIETGIEEGTYFPTAQASKHTVSELVDRYIKHIPEDKKSKRDQIRVLNWWKEQIGSKKLSEVAPALLVEYRDKLAGEKVAGGEKRKAGTVNRYLAYFSHAFTVASREWEWCSENPLRRVSKLKEPRGRVRFLDDKERKALLEAVKDVDERAFEHPYLYPLVVLAISTGARQGELLRLRWADVDLKKGVAVVHETKNDGRRALPLTGLALDLLKERKRQAVRSVHKDRDFVFAGEDGEPYYPRTEWEIALREADIRNFRFHDLRHTAASYLAMNGATLAEIAEVLGHKTLSMVKRYSHLTEQHTSSVVARMNKAVFGDVK